MKEKILELEQTNSVSMPSALFLEAGTELVLFAVRAGTLKLRLVSLKVSAGAGACSGIFAEAECDDMTGISREHRCARLWWRDRG